MIKGSEFRDAVISASNSIAANRQKVDELNVFPVPDGDTGTNMSLSIGNAAKELALLKDDVTVTKVADTAASALLRGARGNSGVILSLLFRGLAKGLKGCDEADGEDLTRALSRGVEAAYKAVMKPTEGTILTVARVSAEKASEYSKTEKSPDKVWEKVCEYAEEALAQTPEQLPVLKKAGVVDAGGMGLVTIMHGMLSVFRDGTVLSASSAPALPKIVKSSDENVNEDLKFTYCAEFTIMRAEGNKRDSLRLRALLDSIGDSVTVDEENNLIKVHVHTNAPGKVLQSALEYGMLTTIGIENRRVKKGIVDVPFGAATAAPLAPAEPNKKYGFVAVAAGDGIAKVFEELGIDVIVRGGQTMNPSTEDILEAVNAVPAECVFVFPNNKNIIMAAEQVAPLTERQVNVLHTKSIPQCVSAMIEFSPDSDEEENYINMSNAAKKVATGLVTFAARDSNFDGLSIKKGQIIGLEGSKLSLVDDSPENAAYRITKRMFKKSQNQFVTLYYGKDASEDRANAVAERISNKYGNDVEVTTVYGGQPVYYYMISVE